MRTEVKRYEKFYSDYAAYYTLIQVSLILTRRPLYYILVIVVPCTLLSLINLMVFLLPTESGEKVSLAITNFLALVLVQQLIGEFIPPADDKFPIILSEYSPSSPLIVTRIEMANTMRVINASFSRHNPYTIHCCHNGLHFATGFS